MSEFSSNSNLGICKASIYKILNFKIKKTPKCPTTLMQIGISLATASEELKHHSYQTLSTDS